MCRLMIYKQVFLPIISDASKVWYPDLSCSYQFKKLEKIQRSVLLHLTRVYSTTSLIKLLNFLGVLNINTQIKLLNLNLDKTAKINNYKTLLIEQVYRDFYKFFENCNSKELIWFITGHDFFR